MLRALLCLGLLLLAAAGAAATGAAARPAETAEPTLRVIFPEGYTAREMVDRVATVRRIAIRKRGITPRLTGVAYRRAVQTAVVPAAFRPYLMRRSSEGFLFPSTYHFTATTSAERLVANQIAAFEERWRTIDLRRARQRSRTPYDVLVIASMVEAETVVPRERRLVAAVIYNRLERGMPLAIDATIRYGLGVPATRPLTRAHLRSNSPYNTRRFKGLPPTPIGNPGLPSLRAAAAPAAVDYLYFVRKPDNKHHFFTADEEEFCRKAREYGYGC